MRTIYKYSIEMADVFSLDLPEGAEILTVQMQHGRPQLWALVDPERPLTPRWFRVAGTGHPVGDFHVQYVNTFQLDNGALVFHLFEILDVPFKG